MFIVTKETTMKTMASILAMSIAFMACGEKTEDTATTEDTTDTEVTDTEDTSSEEADLANGQSVHDSICMACHSGNPAMENQSPNLTDSELEGVIQNGSGSMPGQGLSDTDLRDVIAYLRATYGG
jgi:mono/diheme cytochrome c family protein